MNNAQFSHDDGVDNVLEVQDLQVHYVTPEGDVIAVNRVSFNIQRESTTAMSILRLVQPPGRILGGQVILNGTNDLLALSKRELREIRWREIALVPQGAMNSLNPVMRIKNQIADGIQTHIGKQPRRALKERILELFSLVGLPSRCYNMYPHELSGGMKQRVCIAMAIALSPSLVIADEPTSALDVIVQRIVAQTLLGIRERLEVSMLIIGHDMALLAQLVDRIAVMYAGNMVEIAPVKTALTSPLHPYTQLLIESIPSIKERKPLKLTEGLTHDLRDPPPGCIFQFRCPRVEDRCREMIPPLQDVGAGHQVACHRCG
jgi:oligopeptide/dipeptide ABC transporter ATP-binding protein